MSILTKIRTGVPRGTLIGILQKLLIRKSIRILVSLEIVTHVWRVHFSHSSSAIHRTSGTGGLELSAGKYPFPVVEPCEFIHEMAWLRCFFPNDRWRWVFTLPLQPWLRQTPVVRFCHRCTFVAPERPLDGLVLEATSHWSNSIWTLHCIVSIRFSSCFFDRCTPGIIKKRLCGIIHNYHRFTAFSWSSISRRTLLISHILSCATLKTTLIPMGNNFTYRFLDLPTAL
jgi:hypothetical protein